MTKQCHKISAIAVLLLVGVSLAQLPDVPVFSMWATEVSTDLFGPNKCISCPTQNVPLGEISPGDYIRVEIFVRDWDAEHNRGACEGNIIIELPYACTNVGGKCLSSWCGGVPADCSSDADCPGTHCAYSNCNPYPKVSAFSAVVDTATLRSGATGSLDWARVPCTEEQCEFLPDGLCPCAHFHTSPSECTCTASTCQSDSFCDSAASVFIETLRTDYLFGAIPSASSAYTPLTGPEFLGFAFDPDKFGEVDDDLPRYLGTMLLQASADASGTFIIKFADPELNLLWTGSALYGDYQNLYLNFPGSIPQCTALTSAPAMIDARQPHAITNALPSLGSKSYDLTLSDPCDVATLDTNAFNLSLFPADTSPPRLILVSGTHQTATLTLDRPIPTGHWLCLARSDESSACIGILPGDADGNGLSNTEDVQLSLAALNTSTAYPVLSIDTNRSGVHTAEDALRLIDLLNGAGAFTPWLSAQLPGLPTNP